MINLASKWYTFQLKYWYTFQLKYWYTFQLKYWYTFQLKYWYTFQLKSTKCVIVLLTQKFNLLLLIPYSSGSDSLLLTIFLHELFMILLPAGATSIKE